MNEKSTIDCELSNFNFDKMLMFFITEFNTNDQCVLDMQN